MNKEIDARGLACPEPVVLARKALSECDEITVIVSDETARENVRRMAEGMGCKVSLDNRGADTSIHISKAGRPTKGDSPSCGRSEPLPGPIVLVISSDRMGRGDDELGRILVKSFFHTLGEAEMKPDTMIFFNTGAKLAIEESEVIEDLRSLERAGVKILVCGTCLGYFEAKDRLAAGTISNMYDITETMLGAGKIVQI